MKDWNRKKLISLCTLFDDGNWIESKDQSTEGIRLIQTGNVGDGFYKDREDKSRYISEETFERLKCTEIFEDDILVSRLPDPVGRACILPNTGKKMITAVDCTIIRFDQNKIAPRWFLYYTQSNSYYLDVQQNVTGATRQRISRKNLGKIKIPFPPILEQQRIVSILDKCFSAIEKAKANAEQNLKSAKELFESSLQGVFENRGKGWEIKKLKELTTKVGSGATPRGGQANYKSEGISLVRSMNVHDGEFRDAKLAFIDEDQAKALDGVTLHEDDVLLNITGGSIARCCIIPKEYLPARVNQHVSILRPKKEVLDSRFLNLLLTSKPYKDQLLFIGEQGSTRQAITKVQIEAFKIPLPKLEEQKRIVQKLDDLQTETQKLEAHYQNKLTDLEELKKSILQKAFAGELRTDKVDDYV